MKTTIFLFAFLLLRQTLANQQRRARILNALPRKPSPSWTEWENWTPCTTTVGSGVRVRSRGCGQEKCDKLRGDNYEVQTCTREAPQQQSMNATMEKMCRDDPEMNGTMSCQLYMENSTMAYDIYFSMGCLMAVLDGSNFDEETDESKLVFGRNADPKSGEVSPLFQGNLQTGNLASGKFGSGAIVSNRPSVNQNRGSGLTNVVSAVVANNYCTDVCQQIVVRATGISSFGPQAPTSVNGILTLLATNTLFQGNANAISNEYSNCLLECRLFGTQYALTRLTLANQGQDRSFSNRLLQVSLNIGEGTGAGGPGKRRRRRDEMDEDPFLFPVNFELSANQSRLLSLTLLSEPETTAGPNASEPDLDGKDKPNGGLREVEVDDFERPPQRESRQQVPPGPLLDRIAAAGKRERPVVAPRPAPVAPGRGINVTAKLERTKRQVQTASDPSKYQNPCFVNEEFSRNPRVRNLDGTTGELFFFENKRQRFLRRKCEGRELVTGSLFQPKETVTAERTKQQGLCKQGYLKRYGLMIFFDPEGEYSYSDGRRFSVKLKQFKLESHCEIAVAV